MPPGLLQFCIQATFNTLPSPSNLVRWQKLTEQACALCSSDSCTLPHILTGCPFSLNNGRNTFRHDSVLKVFLEDLQFVISLKKKAKPTNNITFVRPGTKCPRKPPKPFFGLLDMAKDWDLLYDIGSTKLVFPPDFFLSPKGKRPDIVLISRSKGTIIIIELTCPCEENFEERNYDKTRKYERKLVPHLTRLSWTCHLFPIEVGARGYNSISVTRCLRALGFSSKQNRSLLAKLSSTALRASFHIWLARDDRGWRPDPVEWENGSDQAPGLITPSASSIFCRPGRTRNLFNVHNFRRPNPEVLQGPYSSVPLPVEPSYTSQESIHSSGVFKRSCDASETKSSTNTATSPIKLVIDLTSASTSPGKPPGIALTTADNVSPPHTDIIPPTKPSKEMDSFVDFVVESPFLDAKMDAALKASKLGPKTRGKSPLSSGRAGQSYIPTCKVPSSVKASMDLVRAKKPRGIRNFKNNCYANAILQAQDRIIEKLLDSDVKYLLSDPHNNIHHL